MDMKFETLKLTKLFVLRTNKRLIRRVLVGISATLLIFTAARVLGSSADSARIDRRIEKVLSQDNNEDELFQENIKKNKKLAEKLKKKNIFVESKHLRDPVCTGILGSSAIIDDQWRKTGDKFGGYEVVSVGSLEVTLIKDGKEKILKPFGDGVSGGPVRGPGKKISKGDKAREERGDRDRRDRGFRGEGRRGRGMGRDFGGGGDRMREYFSNMSEEEREEVRSRMRNMSREERREYFEQIRGEASSE